MEKIELLERLADYVRLEIGTGDVKPNSPIGIAWRDYAERYEVPFADVYYRGELQKVASTYHAAGVEFNIPEVKASVERKSIPGMKIVSVYADGGVIGSNPSAIGGTYAYRLIEENGEVGHYIDGAFVLTSQMNGGVVTNNHTEMWAVLSALELVPDAWAGTLYSDSQITLGRVFMGWKWANVPKFMHEKYQVLRARLVNFNDIKYVRLDGHPTKAQLQAGKGKRGGPVSEHNVWCDHACTDAGKNYLAQVGELVKELSSVEL
jgi:ribonuclease HI